jgi:uncharacterized protein
MRDETSPVLSRFVDLWDWRRQVAELYAGIRAASGPEAAWRRWRDTRDRLFRAHAQSPFAPHERAAFRGLPYFPYDPRLRFLVEIEAADDARSETVMVGADGSVTLQPFARTSGLADALGGELTLYWISLYGGGVFLPFRDATSGVETYGAGRYLLDTVKGSDLGGELTLDFNFAYNPSCAWDDRWACPLTPPANRLPFRIEAGEQAPPPEHSAS